LPRKRIKHIRCATCWLYGQKMEIKSPQRTSVTRLHVLDGIRGWAALSVVLFHLIWETFGVLHPIYRNPISALFLDGNVAVLIFFILSGEALSYSYFAKKDISRTIKLAIKRYPRLVIPILSVCTVTFFIIRNRLNFNIEAGNIVHREDWLGSWLHFYPSYKELFSYSFAKAFMSPPAEDVLNPFLWTMKPELLGSVLVFLLIAILYIGKKYGVSHLAILIATLIIFGITSHVMSRRLLNNLFCFLIGMFYAEKRSNGWFQKMQRNKKYQPVIIGALVMVCLINGICNWYGFAEKYKDIMAAVMLLCIYSNKGITGFFSNRISQFLGKISFPIYLVQLPVIVAITSYLIVWSQRNEMLSEQFTPWIIISLSTTCCILAAIIFEPVEIFTKKVGNILAVYCMKKFRIT
jgi:peptidoglycan/LPS O-acetylase OafA/YrhL